MPVTDRSEHPPRINLVDCAQVIAELADTRHTVLVGIDGFGGAGKTSLAQSLVERLGKLAIPTGWISVDDFSHRGTPTWDHDQCTAQVIDPFRAGECIEYDVRRWNHAEIVGHRVVPTCRVLILEGVSSTDTESGIIWDLTLWVDTPKQIRQARLRQRDGDELADTWASIWQPSERAYAERDQPEQRVDYVVSTTA